MATRLECDLSCDLMVYANVSLPLAWLGQTIAQGTAIDRSKEAVQQVKRRHSRLETSPQEVAISNCNDWMFVRGVN